MKRRFSDEQIIQMIKEQEAGERTGDVSWPPKTVPVFVDQWSGKEWHGNGIRMRTH